MIQREVPALGAIKAKTNVTAGGGRGVLTLCLPQSFAHCPSIPTEHLSTPNEETCIWATFRRSLRFFPYTSKYYIVEKNAYS